MNNISKKKRDKMKRVPARSDTLTRASDERICALSVLVLVRSGRGTLVGWAGDREVKNKMRRGGIFEVRFGGVSFMDRQRIAVA